MSDDYPDGNSAWERINDSEYVNGKKVMKTNKLAGLDELAVEIMNITGGKYTDEQEQKMMAAISTEVAQAKIDELEFLAINDYSQSEIRTRLSRLQAEVESDG